MPKAFACIPNAVAMCATCIVLLSQLSNPAHTLFRHDAIHCARPLCQALPSWRLPNTGDFQVSEVSLVFPHGILRNLVGMQGIVAGL